MTISDSNLHDLPNAATCCNTGRIKIASDIAVADAGYMNIPWLPESVTMAHIVPDFAHTSVILIAVLCNAGCRVTYDRDECKVYFKNRMV